MNKSPNFSFSPSELSVLHDKAFFEIKHQIVHKWEHFLSFLAENIQKWISTLPDSPLPDEVKNTSPKISKGENYQGMPYMVLDYPRYFGKENTCAFRNILLWNRGLYSTWFFEGKYTDYAIQTYAQYGSSSMYLHQHTDKWVHELNEQDIYIPMPQSWTEENFLIEKCISLMHQTRERLNYLKFTCFLSFQEWNQETYTPHFPPALKNSFIAFENFMY